MSYPSIMTPPAASPLNFVIAKIEGGWPSDQITNQTESLDTPGTDGKRLRVRRREYKTFQMETWIDVANYAAGMSEARLYLLAVGLPVTLAWSAAGLSGTWNKVLVGACEPSVSAGFLTGENTTPGSAAIVRALWTLTVQATEGASP